MSDSINTRREDDNKSKMLSHHPRSASLRLLGDRVVDPVAV